MAMSEKSNAKFDNPETWRSVRAILSHRVKQFVSRRKQRHSVQISHGCAR